MYNVNSPTVQGMLSSTPMGTGNISEYTPGLTGNFAVESFMATPQEMERQRTSTQPMSITQDYIYNNPTQQNNSPYPTPKDMVNNDSWRFNPYVSGMQQQSNQYYQSVYPQGCPIYQPVYNQYYGQIQQYPSAYYNYPNPMSGFSNPIYSGYSNPYMGCTKQLICRTPLNRGVQISDQVAITMEQARKNGISYEEQVKMDSRFWKSLSRACSAGLGRSEEETRIRESLYDVECIDENYFKTNEQRAKEYHDEQLCPPMIVKVVRGNEVIFTNENKRPRRTNYTNFNDQIAHVDRLRELTERNRYNQTIRNNYLYDNAIEREIEKTNCSLMDFFNNQAWKLTYNSYERLRNSQRTNAARLFQKNRFMQRLEMDKHRFDQSRDQEYMSKFIRRAEEQRERDGPIISEDGKRIRGHNGILPNGKRVSSDLSPEMAKAVSESFEFDLETRTLTITPPSWLSSRQKKETDEEETMKYLEDKFIERATNGKRKNE